MTKNAIPLTWAIAVFAHNEAAHIVASLRSIVAATAQPQNICLYVLNNGSRDNTGQIVREFMPEAGARLELIELSIGDKANAWNYFVHELGADATFFGFVDGDVTLAPRALDELQNRLQQTASAHIATGVPFSGRSREKQWAQLEQGGGVQGNLYAAKADFIRALRLANVRMPIGFVREDGLVSAFAMFDLHPETGTWDTSRVAVAQKAGFIVPSLRWWSWSDIRLYWRRRIRYSVGHFEFQLLRPLILRQGLSAMPRDTSTLYSMGALPTLRWRGGNTFFDFLALRRMRARRKHPT